MEPRKNESRLPRGVSQAERHANSYDRYQSTPMHRTESDNRSEGDYRKEDISKREQTAIKQLFYEREVEEERMKKIERQEQERKIIHFNVAKDEILRQNVYNRKSAYLYRNMY